MLKVFLKAPVGMQVLYLHTDTEVSVLKYHNQAWIIFLLSHSLLEIFVWNFLLKCQTTVKTAQNNIVKIVCFIQSTVQTQR